MVMSDEKSEFQLITSPQELESFLSSLEKQAVEFSVFTEDGRQIPMRLVRIEGRNIISETSDASTSALKAGENVQILIGLTEGLFSIKTKVSAANGRSFSFELGNDVYRLQRRNDFRTNIPPETKIEACITRLRGSELSNPLNLQTLDLSAGGMSVLWKDFRKYKPAVGDLLEGVLTLPESKQVEFNAKIISVSERDESTAALGLEFQNLSIQERQRILFTCVQIRRNQNPVVR